MTEIPEHLLKRSRERREALGLPTDGGSESAAAPAAATPAVSSAPAAPATPAPARAAKSAPAAPPPPKPDTAVVAAYKRRKKIPMWAMATLSILPLWAFMYVRALTPGPVKASGPIADGQAEYSSCASCHNADGSGSVGRPFINGAVLKTFPRIEDQLNFVYNGTQQFDAAGLDIYGDPNREGGPHALYSFSGSAMPGQHEAGLTDAQILAVVCHERYDLGGAGTDVRFDAEFEKWCAPDSEVYAGLRDGSLTFATPDLQVGTDPRPALAEQTPPAAAG